MKRHEILIENKRDPLFGYTKSAIVDLFTEKLKGRVEEAYFFGSFLEDSFGQNSDIDLILVADTDKPFLERSSGFQDLLSIVPSCDILVYTPGEFRRLTENPSAGFWRDVAGSMKRFI